MSDKLTWYLDTLKFNCHLFAKLLNCLYLAVADDNHLLYTNNTEHLQQIIGQDY